MKIPQFKTIQQAIAAFGLVLGGLIFLEGNSNVAYKDQGGVVTICSGITQGVKITDVKTDEQCLSMNKKEAQRTEKFIRTVAPNLNPYVEASMIWYVYNIGNSAFINESLVYKRLKLGDVSGACNALVYLKKDGSYGGFVHIGKEVNKGLVNRRKVEQSFCRKGL